MEWRKRPVIMIDKTTNKDLMEFDSIVEALKYLGKKYHSPQISKCIKGKVKTAFGYYWRYK